MSIRTSIKIIGALIIGVLVICGALTLQSDLTMDQLARDAKLANEVVRKITVLHSLTQDYLLNRNERAQRQWSALYAELSQLLEQSDYRRLEAEQGMEDAPDQLKVVGGIFARLLAIPEGGQDKPSGEMQNRLATQLLLATQNLGASFVNLNDEINERLHDTQRLSYYLDFLMLFSLAGLFIGTAVFLQHTVIRPVLKLREDIKIVGGGNLDLQVGMTGGGEIGELSQAFDEMTARLRQVHASLKTERQRFFDVLEEMPGMVCVLKPPYRVVFGNRYFRELFGEVQPDRPCFEWCFGQDKPCPVCHSFDPLETGKPVEWEVALENGHTLHVYDRPFADADGSPMILEMGIDITERLRAEKVIQTSNQFLQMMNRLHKTPDLLQDFVAEVKQLTGCEAVGIRLLDEAGNIPYHAYKGFTKQFYEIESPLTLNDHCMCINVIKGTTDPELPFYTQGGSFYMNGTTRFLATVSEADKGETRNVCNAVGFESVALVPIRLGERIVGLIHLADPKENMVPLETVELLEFVALQLGPALQRVWSREELDAERQRFFSVLERIPAYVALISPDRKLPYVNSEFIRRFGDPGDRLCHEFLFGLEAACEGCKALPIFETKEQVVWEWNGADGNIYQVHDYPFTDVDGSPLVLEMGVDITARKRAEAEIQALNESLERRVKERTHELERSRDELAQEIAVRRETEEALRASEERFRTMANAMPQLAWIAESDGYIFWYNQRWYDYTGTTTKDMEGWGWQSVHDPKVLPAVLEQWKGSIATGQPFDMVFPLLGADGVFRPFLTRVLPLKDADGQVIKWFGTNTDITERQQILADLERSNRELEEFAFISSHDMQEPLRQIANFSEILAKGYQESLDEQGIRYFGFIIDGAKRMQALINDLLSYSRVGQAEIPKTPTSLETVLKATIHDLNPLIEESSAEISHDPLPTLKVNPNQIGQVLQNLVANAIKFRNEQPPKIHLSARQESGEWVISVNDNGIGFNSKYAERIFKLFKRMHSEEKYPGTGIGLAICKKIVERHGGRIWAESEPGHGATFFFTIPA